MFPKIFNKLYMILRTNATTTTEESFDVKQSILLTEVHLSDFISTHHHMSAKHR